MRFFVGGGQQLVAEDLTNIPEIDLKNGQSVDINNETKIITGTDPWVESASINVDNNGKLISRYSDFSYTDINIKNNSNATFENGSWIEYPNFHIINNLGIIISIIHIVFHMKSPFSFH